MDAPKSPHSQSAAAVFLLSLILFLGAQNAEVSLLSPADNAWANASSSSLQFNFTRSGWFGGTTSCLLLIDSEIAGSLQDAAENATISISPQGAFTINEGPHTWYVNCTNSTDFQISPIRGINIDRTPPSFTSSPHLQITYSNQSLSISFTSQDLLSGTLNCSLYANSQLSHNNPSVQNSTNTTFPGIATSSLPAGQNNFTVICYDWPSAGNLNGIASDTATYTISSPPPAPQSSLTLLSPQNGSITNAASLPFSFNFTSNSTTPRPCSLHLNGTQAASNSSVESGAITTFANLSLESLSPDTQISWSVSCTEESGSNLSSSNALRIDRIPPSLSVSFDSPSNSTYIWVNATMNESNPHNLTIRLYDSSGSLVASNTATSALSLAHNYTGLSEGNYSLNVSSHDLAGNQNRTNFSIRIHLLSSEPPPQNDTPQPFYANSTSTATITASGRTCQLSLHRALYSSQSLSTLTTTITNAQGSGCDFTLISLADSIPSDFGAADSISFAPQYTSRSGQSATFNFTSFSQGSTRALSYTVSHSVPAASLASFAMQIAAVDLIPLPPAPPPVSPPPSQQAPPPPEENQSGELMLENQTSNITLILNETNQTALPAAPPSQPVSIKQMLLAGGAILLGLLILIFLIGFGAYLMFRKKKGL